jgi:hypothetical protein
MAARTLFLVPTAVALAACAITQRVTPVERFDGKQVCIIENPAVVQAGFLVAYTQALDKKGYTVQRLAADAKITDCPVTSTYTANWRWDLALYLAFADIKVFQGGRQIGHAVYDAMGGGANMNKFIKGDEKIQELVNQLFPDGPKQASATTKS